MVTAGGLSHVIVEGSGTNEDDADATVTTVSSSSDSDRDSDSDSSVIANITVKFITMCDIQLPMGEGRAAKQWKMLRVFNWTFSGEIDRGREGLEWRISEVATTSWD
jgi:hypothetical protein